MSKADRFRYRCLRGAMLSALVVGFAYFWRNAGGNRETDFGQVLLLAMIVGVIALAGCVLGWFVAGVVQATKDG